MRFSLRDARNDIGVFAKAVGRPLTSWQARAMRTRKRTTAIVAPRQAGKSRSLAVGAAHTAYRQPGAIVLIVSAGEDAARRLLAEVRSIVTGSPLLAGSVVDEQQQLVRLSNGSEIRSVPASERQIRGWSVDLLVLDEAALLDDELILSAAIPTTSARPDARIIMASSPGAPEGVFYSFAQAGSEGAEHVETHTWRLSDAKWISKDVIEAARASLPVAVFEREFEGRFSDVGLEERAIERGWVEAAGGRDLELTGDVAYGLDVARYGSDSSVLCLAVGGVVRVVWSVHGSDLMTLTGRLAHTLAERPAPVWIDSVGVGAGVLDRARELGLSARGFVANAKAFKPDRYANRKSESWWAVRELFRNGLVDLDPQDTVLGSQLAAQRYQLSSSGRIEMVSKREMGGASPDRADAAVIALVAACGIAGPTAGWLKFWRREIAERAEQPAPVDPRLRGRPRFEPVTDRAACGCRPGIRRFFGSPPVCVVCGGTPPSREGT